VEPNDTLAAAEAPEAGRGDRELDDGTACLYRMSAVSLCGSIGRPDLRSWRREQKNRAMGGGIASTQCSTRLDQE
jgi:hypothetical protein